MHYLKKNIFMVVAFCLILILFEIFTQYSYLALFATGFLTIIISLFIKSKIIQRTLLLFGAFLSLLAIFITHSIWLLILAIVLIWILFQTEDGHEFVYSGDRWIHPFQGEMTYHDVVVRRQSQQRTLMTRKPLNMWLKEQQGDSYYDQDINLVFLGGNTILDFANSFMADGEHTVVIRRIYGRTRIILPKDVALKINVSVVSGRVDFEQQSYQLQAENFQWLSPQYSTASRRINLIASLVFGDIEVIIL